MLQQCSHPNVVCYFGSYQGADLPMGTIKLKVWESSTVFTLYRVFYTELQVDRDGLPRRAPCLSVVTA
jgi:hypothetical protein